MRLSVLRSSDHQSGKTPSELWTGLGPSGLQVEISRASEKSRFTWCSCFEAGEVHSLAGSGSKAVRVYASGGHCGGQ